MKKILDLSISDYLEKMIPQESFQEQMLVMELDGYSHSVDKTDRYPIRLKVYSFIVVLSGSLTIEVDYLSHTLEKNTMMHLSVDEIIGNISHSPDFRGYLLVFTPELKAEIMAMTAGIRLQKTGELKQVHRIQELNDAESAHIVKHIEFLTKFMAEKTHLYYSVIIKNQVINLYLDLADMRWKRYGDGKIELSRYEILMQKFRELLLGKCRMHRDVAFYAKELCVTADYLSKVIREYDKQSAIKWIANAVIVEAKFLLREPEKNIQQIAMELNFPDQSTFGKFFKRYAGKSPAEYRREL